MGRSRLDEPSEIGFFYRKDRLDNPAFNNEFGC